MSAQQDLDDDLPAQPSPDAATFRAAFSTSFIVAAAVISLLVVFLILLLQVYAKLLWSRSSRPAAARRGLASAAVPAAGLGAAAIAALPTFTHASKAPLLECAVCLSEFQGDEQGRTLPSCSHSFHTECIDMWLSSHTTCPLCRADVLRAAAPPAAAHHAATDGQEARGAEDDEEERVAGSNPVQLPCNVLVWGDEAHVNLQQQEASSSSSPSAIRPRNRSLPQITIAIPPMDGRVVLTIATPRQHSLSKAEQAASSSSQPAPARSPGLGASLKRMLSRKSSGLAMDSTHHQP